MIRHEESDQKVIKILYLYLSKYKEAEEWMQKIKKK